MPPSPGCLSRGEREFQFRERSHAVSLYIDNLTNSAPYLDFNRVSGVSAATTLRPRTIGIGVKTTF